MADFRDQIAKINARLDKLEEIVTDLVDVKVRDILVDKSVLNPEIKSDIEIEDMTKDTTNARISSEK